MATVNLGQVRDRITAITKTGTTGGTAPVDIYTVYTECSPQGVGTFQVKNGASSFVFLNRSPQGIEDFCDELETAYGSIEPADRAKYVYYDQDQSGEIYIAFGGFMSGHTCTITGYDVTNGHPFRAFRPFHGSFSYVYTDVDTYAYIDQTNYASLDTMCDNAFNFLENAFENAPADRWKRYIAHKGPQSAPTLVFTFVSFAGNTDPDFPIVKKLYGYEQKGGFFCANYDVVNDVWNFEPVGPTRFGPYSTTAAVLEELKYLHTSGVPFNILSAYTSFQETTSDGGTSHVVTRTRSLLLNYKYSEEETDPSTVTFYYIINNAIHTWQAADGNIFLVIDTDETYNPE